MDETLNKIWNQKKDHVKVRTLEARAHGLKMGGVSMTIVGMSLLVNDIKETLLFGVWSLEHRAIFPDR